MSKVNVSFENEKFEYGFDNNTTLKDLKQYVEKTYKVPYKGQSVRTEDLCIVTSSDDTKIESLGKSLVLEKNVIDKFNLYRFPEGKGFPLDVDKLKLEMKYSGYTAPEHVKDVDTGISFILKRGASTKREHLYNEYITTEAYLAGGCAEVSAGKLYLNRQHDVVLVTKFIPNTVSLADFNADSNNTVEQKEKVRSEIKKNFVLDCLLSSWDVVGYKDDHIIVDKNLKPWRINSANCLEYRTTGDKKKPKDFCGIVNEFFTMLDEEINEHTAKVFHDVTFNEIKEQISTVLSKQKEILECFDGHLKYIMKERLRYMDLFAQQKEKSPVPLELFWADELKQMKEKKFTNEKKNIEILLHVGGCLDSAYKYIEKIFYNDKDE